MPSNTPSSPFLEYKDEIKQENNTPIYDGKDLTTNLHDFSKDSKDCFQYALTYLDKKSLNNLSLTSTHYRKEITESIVLLRDNLIKAGFNSDIVSEIRKTQYIENYQKLCRSLIKYYDPYELTLLSQPVVAALSGDVKAIQHQISLYSSPAVERDIIPWALLLHAAAASGSVKAIKYIIDLKKANKQCTDREGRNILHLAALSGSIKAMEFVISLEIDINSKDRARKNILHYAAWSGSVEAVERVRLLIHDDNLNINPNRINVDSLHWNQRENEKEPVKNALKMPIKDLLLKRSLKEKKIDQSLINNFFSELKKYRKKYGTDNPDIEQTVTLLQKATAEPLKVTSQEFLTLGERLLGSRLTQALGVTFMLIALSLGITAVVIIPFLSTNLMVLGATSTSLILTAFGFFIVTPISAISLCKGYGLYEAGGEKRGLASSLNKIESSLFPKHNSEEKSQAKVTSRVDQPFPQTPLDATPHPFSQGNQRSKIK